MTVTFQEGQLVQRGDLLAEIDPRPFEVQLTQVEGQLARDQALLDNARVDLAALSDSGRRGLDPQAAAGHPGSLVRQYEGAVEDRPGADRQRQAAAHLLPHHRADQRARRPAPGRPRQHRARRPITNGLVVITQLQPIAVVFTIPEDSIPAGARRSSTRGATLPVEAYDREQTTASWRPGTLLTVDNQIDPTTGTVAAEGHVPEHRRPPVPQPVRQRAPAARRQARRDRGAGGGDPARRTRARSSTW